MGKAVVVVLVVAVLVMGLVPDMEKDLSMMEEEKGRPYLQLERQIHFLDSYNLISPAWFSIRVLQ